MLEDILASGFAELSLSADPQAIPRCRLFYDTLAEQNKYMNLTAIDGEEDSARLHFLDSAALLTIADFRDKRVIDVGSGAGFPGLVLKIAAPDICLTLLDSLDKRVRFLRALCDSLGFGEVACLHARAEEAPPELRESFDIACSRAVARLNLLCELCLPFVRVGGLFLAMKAAAAAEELTEAADALRVLGGAEGKLLPCTVPGLDAERYLVSVEKLRPTPAKYPRRYAQIKKQPL